MFLRNEWNRLMLCRAQNYWKLIEIIEINKKESRCGRKLHICQE